MNWAVWGPCIAVYAIGVLLGVLVTLVADDVWWYERPLVLIWPVTLLALFAWHAGRFMLGKE